MIPRSIVARPDEIAPARRSDPDILPLPGARGPERERPAPPRPAPAAQDEFGPRDILNALRYHSVLFVTLGTVVAVGLGTAAWYLVPTKYTTYSLIYVAQNDPKIMGSANDATSQAAFGTLVKSEASKIKSNRTIKGALRDPAIANLPMLRREEDPEAFLEEKIIAEPSETNQLLKVSLTGDDPVQITTILRAVVSYYEKELKEERQMKTRRIALLEKAKGDLGQNLKDKLRQFATDFPVAAANEAAQPKHQVRVREFVELKQLMLQAQVLLPSAREILKAAQSRLEQFDATPPPLPDLTQALEKDQNYLMKKFTVERARKALDDFRRQSSNPDGPQSKVLAQKLAVAATDLEAYQQKFRATAEGDVRTLNRPKFAAAVEQAQARVAELENQERTAVTKLDEYKDVEAAAAEQQKKPPEQVLMEDSIGQLRLMLERINLTLLSVRNELEAPDRVQIWQPAEVPSKREMKKQLAVTGFGGIAGFGLIGGCLTLYEVRRKRVYGAQDPLFRQRLPLLGCLPELGLPPASAAASRGEGTDPAGRAFFEAVDKVKTVLYRQMQRRGLRALLVTSAAPREGKSALAWHLALSLARTDKRTLFIDGNLRNPGLHNHFDIASHPGLSELLRGEKALPEVVQRTGLANLWCIAAGVCDELARQALDKDALRRLLERARNDYDFVVIDACSIREAVDPLYLAQRADATVLAVRAFQSRTTDVERACERLSQLGTPLLGAVLADPTGAGAEL